MEKYQILLKSNYMNQKQSCEPIDETGKCFLTFNEGYMTCNYNHTVGADCLGSMCEYCKKIRCKCYQKQSWEETLENIIRGILSRYENKFNFDFKAAERSWGKKAGMENFLREEFSSAIKQAIKTREREISEESNKYHELIMAVAKKYPGETRHQTAIRYIQERENQQNEPSEALNHQ